MKETYKIPDKPIVHYHYGSNSAIILGGSVLLFPIDHTSPYVSNDEYAKTSKVIAVYGNGIF